MNQNIDNANFYSDHRVIAADSHWYSAIDEKRMVATAKSLDGETEGQLVSFAWGVCPTCNGKGTHVTPSIDCGGLSASDFDDDPDFAHDYMSGVYDVPCYGCQGRRVVPECTDEKYLKKIEAYYNDLADMRAEYLAEIRFGA